MVVLARHTVLWDVRHNRPLTAGNQVLNPNTGILEAVGPEGYTPGPPAIDFFVHNIRLPPVENCFRGSRSMLISTLNEVMAEIGLHLKDEEYSMMSINASQYSVVLLLMSERTEEDLGGLFRTMKTKLHDATYARSQAATANDA